MTIIDALEAIEAAPLGNARLAALKENDSEELRELLNYALSPDITFGIKALPAEGFALKDALSDDIWWIALRDELLVKLASRELTGGAARTAVGEFLISCGSEIQEKWAKRVILQDLRLNIGAKDVNKVLGDVVKLFAVPLAEPFKELKSTKGHWAWQPKLDGGRCVAIWDPKKKTINLKSRTGKEWGITFDPIRKAMTEWCTKLQNDGHFANFNKMETYFDGELIVVGRDGRMDFQAIQKLFHNKTPRIPNGELQYVMFDAANGSEYRNPQYPYGDRLTYLEELVKRASLPSNIKVTATEKVIDPTVDWLNEQARTFVETLGCDGGIMRRLDAVPRNKRSKEIVKVKPFEDAEATVIGKIEGKGRLEGMLGTLVCKLIPSGIEFEIGTGEGFNDEIKRELWKDPNLIGSIVNFKYQRLSDDGVPVLPTFRAIRHPNDV